MNNAHGYRQRSEHTSRCPSTCRPRLTRSNTHCYPDSRTVSVSLALPVSWFHPITDRTQFIRVGSESSVVTNCSCNVPQGSCSNHYPLSHTFSQLPRWLRNSMYRYCTISMQTTHSCTLLLSKTLLTDAVSNLQNCLVAVHMWFTQNGQVVNPERSEAVLLWTAQQSRAAALPLNDVNVAGQAVLSHSQTQSRYWAWLLTRTWSLINAYRMCANLHTTIIRVHPLVFVTRHGLNIASAFVNSHLDYTNSVLYDTSAANIIKTTACTEHTCMRGNEHETSWTHSSHPSQSTLYGKPF